MTFRKTGRMLQPAELNRKTGAELGRVQCACQLDSHVCLNDESKTACKVGPDGREVDAGIENTSEL